MSETIVEIITKKAEEKIKEELAQRIPEPRKLKKIKYNEIPYVEKYKIANNFTGYSKQHIIDLLRVKKCSDLMLIN